ncbi:Chromosome partition protein Smc [uncultured archaeon]|nr:Chromosome partition protein Smc [uncultured archaeon]
MVFGSSHEKSAEAFTEEVAELKNQVKLVELDLEKRMILLEGSINNLQKSIGSIQQFESSKDAVLQIQEIKGELRELEDTGLISKLETISNNDKLIAISESVDTLGNKVKLLSDAIDILSELKSKPTEGAVSEEVAQDVSSIKAEMGSLKSAISRISTSVPSPEKIIEIGERIKSLEKAGADLNSELKKIYDAYREKTELLERRITISAQSQGTTKESSGEIPEMIEEIKRLKEVNRRIIGMIEIDSKTLHDLKSLRDEGTAYKHITSTVAELSKKISDISREMNLDHAMYPKTLMKLEKEVSEMKAAQANLKDTVQSLAMSAKGRPESSENEKKLQIIEKSLKDISGKISEAVSLKDMLDTFQNEISGLKVSHENIKGDVKLLDSSIAGRKSSKADAASVDERIKLSETATLSRIKELESAVAGITSIIENERNEIESGRMRMLDISRELDALKDSGNKPGRFLEKAKKAETIRSDAMDRQPIEALSQKLKSLAEENNALRHEIEQVKQMCAEIMKEHQQQPIIID